MGCVCCSLSSFVSILLDALERISLCTVCAMLTCCLLFTILTVMILGIGIGYHYCFVQTAVEAMEKAAMAAKGEEPQHDRSMLRSVNKAVNQHSLPHRVARRDADVIPPINNKMYNKTMLNNGAPSTNNTLNRIYSNYNTSFIGTDTFDTQNNATFNRTSTFNGQNDESFNRTSSTIVVSR